MGHRTFCLLTVVITVLFSGCNPISGFPPGLLLEHPRGPYHGKVIDADTREPIAGAAVLAIWDHQYSRIVESNRDYWQAREVVTGSDGTFLLDALDIEERAGRTVWRPRFIIYAPGYGYFPAYQVSPRSPQPGLFEGEGATVELRKLTDPAQRRLAISHLPPDVPPDKMRALLVLLNDERAALGFTPVGRGAR